MKYCVYHLEVRAVRLLSDFCFVLARLNPVSKEDASILKKIGANIFGIVRCIFLHDIPVPDDELGDIFSFMIAMDCQMKKRLTKIFFKYLLKFEDCYTLIYLFCFF